MKLAGYVCAFFLFMGAALFATTQDAYAELPITLQQERDITKLIRTLANTSTVGLMFKKGELERIGERITGIHPLRYIGFIYADPELKECMPKLLSKSMVSTRFIKELSAGLNQKLEENQLVQYVPGFASSLNLTTNDIMPFVDNRTWGEMLDYLNIN